jgi:hypothetical protein
VSKMSSNTEELASIFDVFSFVKKSTKLIVIDTARENEYQNKPEF